MEASLNLGNGNWATKEDSLLSYSDENGNFRPLPFDFTRGSTATVINKAGLMETVDSGIARIDFQGTADGSLLLEPASTNLQSYSQVFSGYSGSNKVITDNVTISPDGTVTGAILSDDNSGGVNVVQIFDNVTVDVSSIYTWSIFAKKKDLDFISLRLNAFSTPSNANSYFDLNLGTVVSEGNGQTATIENYGNGWYRCSITFTTDAVDTSGTLVVRLSDNGTNTTVDLDNTSNIYIWGSQFEKLPYATSYILTNGESGGVTRAAEVCDGAGDVTTFNSAEGVLYVEINPLDTGLFKGIGIGQVTGDSLWIYATLDNKISAQIRIGGATQFYLISNTILSGFNKVAFKWSANDFSLWVNGNEEDSSSVGNLLPANTLQSLQFKVPGASNNFYGKTKQLQVFKTALTDAELQTLTTL